jgi:hypothetical protein
MRKSEIDSMNLEQKTAVICNAGINSDEVKLGDYDRVLATVPEERTCKYANDIRVGTIIAYRQSDFTVKSAKVIRKSIKNRKLMIQMKFGTEKLIDFDDVVWVKTTERWPKWVFNLLKGVTDEAEAK